MAFSWKRHQEKALAKALYRSIHQCRCNPDYKLKHVGEAKANPKLEVLKTVNPEARKRIEHAHIVHLKLVTPPVVQRPARVNRSE